MAARGAARKETGSGFSPPELSTRERIEAAALALFVERGVDAATTREIARAAGVSEGAIYRHFDSKDELAAEMFFRIHARLAGLIREAARSKRGIAEQTGAVIDAYCATADENFPLFAFHLLYTHRFLPSPEDVDNPVEAIEDIVSAAMKRREIARGDAGFVAGLALGLVLQTALQIHYGRLEGPLSQYAADLVVAALGAMRAGER
ncbi:MAG TPA: helix-turn-helix domain-containing protein [Parvularculaceae bacterium]|nr:helix-turn-helix domain-containing protein [Parvularculaceae bacterium]